MSHLKEPFQAETKQFLRTTFSLFFLWLQLKNIGLSKLDGFGNEKQVTMIGADEAKTLYREFIDKIT